MAKKTKAGTGKKAPAKKTKAKAAKKTKAKAAATKPKSAKKKPTVKKQAAKQKTPAKKQAAQKTAAKQKAPAKKQAAKKRRDATGHLDPNYARDLRRLSRENVDHDDDRAFLVGKRKDDALADELGKEFVETVTSGEDEGVELRDAEVPEEIGGPFVTSDAGREFADDTDESNPADATREPFPKS